MPRGRRGRRLSEAYQTPAAIGSPTVRRAVALRPVVPARWRNVVKKLFALVLLAAAGFAVWRKMESDRAEQALWAEVTDPVK